MSKLDHLLNLLYKNPGLTRKEIKSRTGIRNHTLAMYLSSMYGYRSGGVSWRYPRPEYLCAADYKPAKGRIIKQYFLTELGSVRAQKNL